MLNNNQNLNNKNLNNQNLNNGGIELGQVREVQYVPQQVAHVPAQAQTRYLYQCQTAPDNQKSKYINKCFIAIIIIFMIASSICFIINDRNIQENKTTIELLKVNADEKSSNQRDPQGNPVVTPTFFVEGNILYSSTSPEPIFNLDKLKGGTGEKGNNGKDGQPGHSPEIDIHTENGNLKVIVDGKEKTNIDLNQKLLTIFKEKGLRVEERDGQLMMGNLDGTWVKINVKTHSIGEYMAMPECPGVKQAGKTYDPIKDEFFSGIFEESYQKRHTYNNHFDDVCRFPDFVKTIESDFKANQKATSNTITSREQYQQTKSNGASASVGYGMFFSANVNTVTEKSMNAFSSSGAAIVQTSLNHQLHVVTIEPLAASKYIRSDILKMVEDLPTNYLENLSDYERFFEVVKGYFVVSKENVGGSILSESTIENWNSLSRKYTSADIEGGVTASIGLFGGSAGGSSSDYQSSMDSDFINSLSTSTVIFGGDATGDLTSPSETITNFKNWDNKEWQKYFERVKKSPTVIGLNVDPLWVYFEGDNREKIKDYMLYYFGTTEDTKYRMRSDIAFANKKIDELRGVQSEAKKKIDDVVKIVDDNKSQTENSINDNKAALDRSIHSVSNKVPCSATASFVNCHDVGKAEMGGHGHDNVCSTGEIVQTMDMFHSYGNAFYVTNVHCCRIQINLWNGNNGASC
jgi:hypothetical protein